jgi:hypothetical protein
LRAADGSRVDVGGVDLEIGRGFLLDRRGERPDSAAQVEHDRSRVDGAEREIDEEPGAEAWDEHAGLDLKTPSAERGPPEHLLERGPGDAPLHEGVELGA